MKFDFGAWRRVALIVLALVLWTANAVADTAENKEEADSTGATYEVIPALGPCRAGTVMGGFAVDRRAERCSVRWEGGASEFFDDVVIVGRVSDDRLIGRRFLPLFFARRGRTWHAFQGGRASREAFTEIMGFKDVLGDRYWIAHAGSRAFLVSADASGWHAIPVVGSVILRWRLPLFVTDEEDGQYVHWGADMMGPWEKVERLESKADVEIFLPGRPDPILFVDGQD